MFGSIHLSRMKKRDNFVRDCIWGFSFGVLIVVAGLAGERQIIRCGFAVTANRLNVVDD